MSSPEVEVPWPKDMIFVRCNRGTVEHVRKSATTAHLIGTDAGAAEDETRCNDSVQEKYGEGRLIEDGGLPERLEEYIKRAS